jgi:ATP synthase protein I|tara:strand:+ start:1605 stop:2003 length:399 start_codon:yes stop_codon:yes gene_type:complete
VVSIKRPPVYQITLWQLSFLLALGLGLSLFDGRLALAALAGGLIQIIPSAYFSLLAFRYRGARASYSIVRSFYRGEVGKYVMTLVGFAAVFSVFGKQLQAEYGGVVFVSYAVMLLVQFWATPRVLQPQKKKP